MDKLVKVWTLAGVECWVLIHVEVQTTRDDELPLRMYVYHYRIFDRYNKPIASLAVLADDDPHWRPAAFQQSLFGCESVLRFPAAKLLDLDESKLDADSNLFGMIVSAHLQTLRTRRDPPGRQVSKLKLVRSLYERGLAPKDLRSLLRLIDWFMVLPPPLDFEFGESLEAMEKKNHVPFVSSMERYLTIKALRKGLKSALKIRFGDEGLQLMPELERVFDIDKLEAVLVALETATTLDEVRAIYADSML